MKKTISILLTISMFITLIYPCESVIAAEIRMNNATQVSSDIAEMTKEYNGEYEEKLDNTDVESIPVDNRVIVKTKSKINTYDCIDEVYGLGYAFVQFENSESAQAALEHYKKQGLTAETDKVYNLNYNVDNEHSTYASTSSTWAYSFTEADTTVNYFKNKNLNNITVGIVDSGIDYTHSMLKSRIIRTNVNFSTTGLKDNEIDDEGHGTSCAGIIAQCTPSNVKLAGFKAGNSDGKIYVSALLCTFEYILNMSNKPDILNMSFGGYGEPNPIETNLLKELKESGITLIASAGNENLDTADSTPANDENVFAVSAFDPKGEKCTFSNYGETVDMAAPGINIYTTSIGGNFEYNFSGTSASAPFVSAAAAVVLMQDNTKTPDEVFKTLKTSAFNRNRPSDRLWAGAGLLNFTNLIESSDRKSEVSFNYKSGEYQDTIKVELSCTDKLNTKIVYTTDGTLPSSSNGTTYKNAIEITDQANIIAAAFPIIGNALHSNYTSANYQIFKSAKESDFEISDDGDITAYSGTYTAILVPDTINGITPTAMGENCFKNSSIVHIELPDTIKKIKTSAFENSNLQKIKASGVTHCWQSAFKNCASLYEENMPNIEYINEATFYNCNMLTKLSFKDSLKYAQCGAGVDGIGALKATGITEADFPNLISSRRAFENTPVKYANLPKLTELDGGFKNCTLLSELNIPSVTVISREAFANCVSLPKEMNFSNITEVGYFGFKDSLFETLNLPNCTYLWGDAFYNASAKSIDLPKCKTLGGNDFAGDKLEYVNIENAENIDNTIEQEFTNCFSLKSIYAPKLKQIPSYVFDEKGINEIEQGKVPVLEYVYTPHAEKLNYKYCDYSECLNMKFLYAPNLESTTQELQFPKSDNFTLYLSDKFSSNTDVSTLVSGNYTVIAPKNSNAEIWANNKNLTFIPSDARNNDTEKPANVTDLGRSICTSATGLRFGFTWDNINEIEALANEIEYGFIYSQKGADDLSIDTVDGKNVKKALAPNRIENNGTTSFNLVISNIPKQYYDRNITARAYVYIDGMYFYSNTLKGSFGEVAGLVLADDEIDQNTKNAVNKLLEA